ATAAIELGLSDPTGVVRADAAIAVNRSLLAALQPLRKGEELRLMWLVANGRQGSSAPPLIANALAVASRSNDRDAIAAMRVKQSAPLCWAVGRVGAVAKDVGRARQLVARVSAALHSVAAPGVHVERRGVSEPVAA